MVTMCHGPVVVPLNSVGKLSTSQAVLVNLNWYFPSQTEMPCKILQILHVLDLAGTCKIL